MPVAPRFQSGCQVQVSCDGIGRGLEPALGGEQVDPAVAVDVARADAVAGGLRAEVVLLELEALAVGLLDDLVPDDDVDRVGQDVGDAVAGQVDSHGRLDGARHVDLVIGPGRAGLARVLDPADVLAEVRDGDEVGVAVAVDVERQRREVVVVRAHSRCTSRTWCGFQSGAWYQVSPQTMSSLPSLSTSKTPAASNSLWPLIVCCFHFGSPARTVPQEQASQQHEHRDRRCPCGSTDAVIMNRDLDGRV